MDTTLHHWQLRKGKRRSCVTFTAVLAVVFVALAVGNPAAAVAQKPTGRLTGIVTNRADSMPVASATVVFLGDGRAVTTDSTGVFRIEKLPSGILRFLVRANGFPSVGIVLAFANAEVMDRRIELDSSIATAAGDAATAAASGSTRSGAQALPMVAVEAEASLGPRFASFERRRRTGGGQYMVRSEIEARGYSSLQDIARGMRGVNVECGGGLGCYIRMVRAPMRCLPEYIVDDNVDNVFGPTIPVRDIEALEVYTGPSDVPGEYAGRNAGCGVVVIWTRSGPPKRKKL